MAFPQRVAGRRLSQPLPQTSPLASPARQITLYRPHRPPCRRYRLGNLPCRPCAEDLGRVPEGHAPRSRAGPRLGPATGSHTTKHAGPHLAVPAGRSGLPPIVRYGPKAVSLPPHASHPDPPGPPLAHSGSSRPPAVRWSGASPPVQPFTGIETSGIFVSTGESFTPGSLSRY